MVTWMMLLILILSFIKMIKSSTSKWMTLNFATNAGPLLLDDELLLEQLGKAGYKMIL